MLCISEQLRKFVEQRQFDADTILEAADLIDDLLNPTGFNVCIKSNDTSISMTKILRPDRLEIEDDGSISIIVYI